MENNLQLTDQQKKLKPLRNIILVLVLVLFSGWVGYTVGAKNTVFGETGSVPKFTFSGKESPKNISADFSLFWSVWNELSEKYVDKSKLDAKKMVYGAISGMVASVDDPYTVFLPPTENKESKEQLNGNFQGIGAQLGMKDKRIVVIAPLNDSPAERAGILPGDWILKVDGKETMKWTLPEAVAKIRGPKGSTVTLNILHEGEEEPKDVKIKRDEIVLNSVEWEVVSSTKSAGLEKAVLLKLMRFGDQTDPQWDRAVSEINSYMATNSGAVSGVILDVRNNPGGYLAGAVFTAGEFLPKNTVVVKQKSYDGNVTTYSVDRAGKLLDVPLVVLINKGSASASEILAGALSVAKRAKLVGEQSFGKGSVQQAEDLPDGAGLHVTTAKWLLSNDDWIQGKGLTPDVEEASDSAQIDAAIRLLNE